MKKTIIICGNPRSGTQMLSKIVQLHPSVVVTGELPPPGLTSAFDLIRQLDAQLQKLPKRRENWNSRRARLLIDIWVNVSTSAIIKKAKECSIIGNKTPGAEFHLDQFEWIFAPNPPLYIYCLREGAKVLRSLKNMPWNRSSFKMNLQRYKESVRAAEAFQKRFPNRILFCQIDKTAQQKGGITALGRTVFDFLDTEITPAIMAKLKTLKPAQPVQAVTRAEDIVELSRLELSRLNADREYRRICEKYGYSS